MRPLFQLLMDAICFDRKNDKKGTDLYNQKSLPKIYLTLSKGWINLTKEASKWRKNYFKD